MNFRNTKKTGREILSVLKRANSIIVFDTETTGFKNAKIIQFSGIKYFIDEEFHLVKDKFFDIYINPEEPIPAKITEITGITDEMVAGARTEKEEFQNIMDFLYSADVWAAYNYPFDKRQLEEMAERLGRKIFSRPSIDILILAKDMFPGKEEIPNHKLGTVAQYMFSDLNVQYHSAIDDVIAAGKLLDAFIPMYMNSEEEAPKLKLHVEFASVWVNPNRKSQKRIKLKLSDGQYGDIYWDIVESCWSCKSDTKAKALFNRTDIADLERQVLNKYAWKYRVNDMDSLAKAWEKAKRESK